VAPREVERGTAPARGAHGEDLACRYLEQAGCRILARNYRSRGGEVDIVARDGPTTAFVEVKERGSAGHGAGYEAVTSGKRNRIVAAARIYAATHGLSESPLRFDVISIDWGKGEPVIRHDKDAFAAS
jgi:putative endonuclease